MVGEKCINVGSCNYCMKWPCKCKNTQLAVYFVSRGNKFLIAFEYLVKVIFPFLYSFRNFDEFEFLFSINRLQKFKASTNQDKIMVSVLHDMIFFVLAVKISVPVKSK